MRTKFLMIALFVALSWTASAQQYRTAGGLMIDIGDGTTLVGPTVKHFFTGENAIAGSLLFGNNFTVLSAEYSYNKPIQGAEGLNWNIGVGPQLGFGGGDTHLYIRPALGLEFKIPSAPLALGFDWRPLWHVDHGSNFIAGRFGLTFKYVFSN
jgi:hypothetical protein